MVLDEGTHYTTSKCLYPEDIMSQARIWDGSFFIVSSWELKINLRGTNTVVNKMARGKSSSESIGHVYWIFRYSKICGVFHTALPLCYSHFSE